MAEPKKLSFNETLKAFSTVAITTYKASPLAAITKIIGTIIGSAIPLVITFVAAQATTYLAAGFAGDEQAGARAIWCVAATVLLGVLMMAWHSLQNYIDQFTSYKISSAISDQLYEHFVSIDFWRYDDKDTVDMFDKAQSFVSFFSQFFDAMARIIASIVSVIVALVSLFSVSWWIGLILFLAIIPSAIVQLKLSRLQTEHWRKYTEARRRSNSISWSVMQPQNLAELRIYNAARYMLDMRAKWRDKDQLERIQFERAYIIKRLAADVVEAIAQLVGLLSIVLQIIHRAQPIGQFVLVEQMMSRALGDMGSLITQFNSIDQDIAAMVDFQRFMRLPRNLNEGRKLLEPPQTIELRNVSFHYLKNDKLVLSDINMKIRAGQRVAIVGENGAGKSTLIKLLLGLYQPTRGQVLLDNVSLTDINKSSWHSYLGVLQQDFIKYRFATAYENVVYGDVQRSYDEQHYQRSIKQAEASTFIDKLPKKRDTILGQWFEHDDGINGVDLSGGQWQRLALARNFYRQAPIVILDEPTSAIDALAESRIFARLFGKHGNTIIAISHRYTTIKKADVVYMMQNGKIVEQGSVDELVARRGEFYKMFASQIE